MKEELLPSQRIRRIYSSNNEMDWHTAILLFLDEQYKASHPSTTKDVDTANLGSYCKSCKAKLIGKPENGMCEDCSNLACEHEWVMDNSPLRTYSCSNCGEHKQDKTDKIELTKKLFSSPYFKNHGTAQAVASLVIQEGYSKHPHRQLDELKICRIIDHFGLEGSIKTVEDCAKAICQTFSKPNLPSVESIKWPDEMEVNSEGIDASDMFAMSCYGKGRNDAIRECKKAISHLLEGWEK